MINKLFLLFIFILNFNIILSKKPYLDNFIKFKEDYNKTYKNEAEFWYRYKIFSDNFA